jgi:hypothetical protein
VYLVVDQWGMLLEGKGKEDVVVVNANSGETVRSGDVVEVDFGEGEVVGVDERGA